MSVGESQLETVDGEPPSLYPRSPSWQPAVGDFFSQYDELLMDANYGRLLSKLQWEQTKEDRETDRNADAQATLRRMAIELALDQPTQEPKPVTGPLRVLERIGIKRAR